MRLIAVGKTRPWRPGGGAVRALRRAHQAHLTLVELAPGLGSPAEIKRREAEALLAALAPRISWWRSMAAGERPTAPNSQSS